MAGSEMATEGTKIDALLDDAPRVSVKIVPERPSEVVIHGTGYPSGEEARLAGERARSALRIASVRRDLPIDIGNDEIQGRIADHIREQWEAERDIVVRSAVHGLDWFPTPANPLIQFGLSAQGIVGYPSERLIDAIRECWPRAQPRRQDDDVETAIDLLFLSHFERGERAQFLTLVTALEVLAGPLAARPEPAMKVLTDLIENAESARQQAANDSRGAIESLIVGLEHLREVSIGSTIRGYVRVAVPDSERFGGLSASKFADDCYGLRSGAIHEGKDVGDPRELRRLVRMLIEIRLEPGA